MSSRRKLTTNELSNQLSSVSGLSRFASGLNGVTSKWLPTFALVGLLSVFAVPASAQGPQAVDDSLDAVSEVPTTLNVLDNDIENPHPINTHSIQVLIPPQNGTVIIEPWTGEVMYESNVGYEGLDSFSYVVNDINGNVSNIAEVDIDVAPNMPPEIILFQYFVDEFGFHHFGGFVDDEEPHTLEFTVGGILANHLYVEHQVQVDSNGSFEFALSLGGETGDAIIQATDSLGQMSDIVSVEVVD